MPIQCATSFQRLLLFSYNYKTREYRQSKWILKDGHFHFLHYDPLRKRLFGLRDVSTFTLFIEEYDTVTLDVVKVYTKQDGEKYTFPFAWCSCFDYNENWIIQVRTRFDNPSVNAYWIKMDLNLVGVKEDIVTDFHLMPDVHNFLTMTYDIEKTKLVLCTWQHGSIELSLFMFHLDPYQIAQNLHARAQTELKPNGEHYVLPRRAPKGYDERKNIEKFHKACQVMREAYFNYMGDLDNPNDKRPANESFNKLFTNAPWISVILGNLSSRPSKRGGHGTINQNITVRNLRGENPKLLDNRAITVERVSAHSGTHFLNYLSVYEGLKTINYDELHEMYLCSKSCRDFMRNTALSLHMTDFDIAWFTMIGETRPDNNEIISLAKNFNPNQYEQNSNKETLAWLELYAYDLAKLVYKCILDKDPSEENFDLHSPLRSGFPNLAEQLKIREESDEFGRYAQADMTNFMNNNLDYVLGTHECLTLQACYAAADVVNAPEGGLNIELTRRKPN
ncbi:unnamed protein product [Rotaria sp. Silwood1]|nr:unnamed protein product [Rotaria sp. Silwood1]